MVDSSRTAAESLSMSQGWALVQCIEEAGGGAAAVEAVRSRVRELLGRGVAQREEKK